MDWSASGPLIYKTWLKLNGTAFGRKAFTKMIGWLAPYSGSLPATVTELKPGHASIELQDKRAVRNHLRSLHAMALINVAELASGLSMMVALDNTMRGILKGFEIEYVKKARGVITAKAQWSFEISKESKQYIVPVELVNSDNETVATAKAIWLIGPKDKPAQDKK